MKNADNTVHVHVVHSMKGGCGKSAFSLFKAITLARDANVNESLESRVLYIDADFKGTSLQYLLCDSFMEQIKKGSSLSKEVIESRATGLCGNGGENQLAFSESYKSVYLNDYLKGDYEHRFCDLFMESIVYQDHPGSAEKDVNGRIDFVFSSPEMKEKNIFRNRDERLGEGRFANNIASFLKTALRKGRGRGDQISGQYTQIIIDMPPGHDSYSDLLLLELKKLKRKYDNIKIYYYSVTTDDRGHLKSMKENLADIEQYDEDKSIYNNVNAVLCCMGNNDFKNYKEIVEDLQAEKWWKPNRNLIFLVPYQNEYREFCRNRDKMKFPCRIVTL